MYRRKRSTKKRRSLGNDARSKNKATKITTSTEPASQGCSSRMIRTERNLFKIFWAITPLEVQLCIISVSLCFAIIYNSIRHRNPNADKFFQEFYLPRTFNGASHPTPKSLKQANDKKSD